MARIVDPNRFLLLGGVTDWLLTYRRHVQRAPRPEEIARLRGLQRHRIVQLRWLLDPGLGYPTEPFHVWRRPAVPMQIEKSIDPVITYDFFGLQVFTWSEPRVFVRATFQVSGTAFLIAYAGAPLASSIVAMEILGSGFREVKISGAAIQCLVVSSGADLQELIGVTPGAADDPSWTLVEHVALPVDASWSGVEDLDVPQGLAGAPLAPADAALDRFRRGAPFYGWNGEIESGLPAPPWQLADPGAMVAVLQQEMLEPLRQMIVTRPPGLHSHFEVEHQLPLSGSGDPAAARFFPLRTLLLGAATDPLVSLISGFGTAIEDIDIPPIVLNDRQLFGDPNRSDWDFMVTARYARGENGGSGPVEYAALLLAPAVALPPPVPAGLGAATEGHQAPAAVDQPWRGVTRVRWDKIPDSLPFRAGSYAFARAQLSPAGGVQALMDRRPLDTALQPISATTSPEQEQSTGKLGALDDRYSIAATPATNALKYGLAHQNLMGLWSPWATTPHTIGEPPVQKVSILSARLDVAVGAEGAPCPATLVVELAWDWTARSLRRFELAGRLYPQARRNDPPADLSLPAGLPFTLGSTGSLFKVQFNGGAFGTPDNGQAIGYVSLDGKSVQGSPIGGSGMRRYRVTISGFSLSFAATGHIGLALWARGIENAPPQRAGSWSGQPAIASASDPRPPKLVLESENVRLASMADAAGEHHAQLEWPAAPGAVGYFIYTTTESKLRADHGMTPPELSKTLSQRLAELRAAFAANPERRSFTRVNERPIASPFAQITLPRGSKEVHLYMVLAVSAGQVESPWPQAGEPNVGKRPVAYAAPQVAQPAPPDLEIARVQAAVGSPPAFHAAVKVRTNAGAAVSKVQLYRVRVAEAALELDTMGPPLATITGSAGPWTVEPTVGGGPGASQALGVITGDDPVAGSWKRVFYRAVAWGTDDPARGIYGGRSRPSAVREVVVPPAAPPDLSPLVHTWPGDALPDVQITAGTLAPLETTPLGPHRLRVDVYAEQPDGTLDALFRFPATPADPNELSALPSDAPAPEASGLWREPGGQPGQTALQVLARRVTFEDQLKVRMLLTDPLGRSTERTLTVPAGSPLPAPDILDPKITRVRGRGFLLSFRTTVPFTATPVGAFQLAISLTVRPGPAQPPGRPIRLKIELPQIKIAKRNENVFADPFKIPVRRGPAARNQVPITIALRGGGGKVDVTLRSPDGRTARFVDILS